MRYARFLAAAAVPALLATSASADGRNPGSVLVFPVHRSGIDMFTILSVTNSNLAPVTPTSFGGTTYVHYEYANVQPNTLTGDPFTPFGCTVFDRVELLTPADTLSVMTACHNAFAAQGQEGYVIVSAQDPSQFDTDWSHNYLMGSALVVNSSGGVYGVNAIPFSAVEPAGTPTDVNANGVKDFDDVEYEGVPERIFIDAFIATGLSHLALINLTGNAQATNVAHLTVWNDNEYPLSATRPFNCWFDRPLVEVSPLFDAGFLANNTPNDPDELDVTCGPNDNPSAPNQETGWAMIDSLGVDGGPDGALLGAITIGPFSRFDGGHLLWESEEKQLNGAAFAP